MSETKQPSSSGASAVPYPSPFKAWFIVGILMLCYVFSFVDRQIISLLVGPIKRDLGLTDIQVGMLQGLAFAFLYTVLGIPIGRMADKMNRRNIIAAGVLIWSIAATYCGLAKNVFQLFLGRIGVGVGEAALSPAAYSMMTDLFPREKQGSAFSIYNMGITLGSAFAYLIGGLVVVSVSGAGQMYTLPLFGEVRAWQMAFIVAGLPGILLPLLLFTFKDPARRGLMTKINAAGETETVRPSIGETFAYAWQSRSFYSKHFFAWALLAMVGYGVGAWLPEAVHRTYGIPTGEIGLMIGIGLLVVNTPAVFGFGKVSDFLLRKGMRDAPVVMCMVSAIGIAVLSALPYHMPTVFMVWVMFYIQSLTFHGYVALSPMIVSQVTPNQMRAQVSAMCLFVVNMLGLGVGPSIPPLLTKLIFNDETQIRWGLTITIVLGASLAAVLFALERAEYKKKMEIAATWH